MQCKKCKCKLKGRLNGHMRDKNDEGKENSGISELLAFILFLEIFNSAKESLLSDECYPSL